MKAGFLTTCALVVLCGVGVGVANATAKVVTTTTPTATTQTTTTKTSDGAVVTTKTTYYGDYDANNNGILDSKEFYNYTYKFWDTNHDGYVSDAEWNARAKYWYAAPGESEYQTYTYWDKNGDGRIDNTEFDKIVTGTKLYANWDTNADGYIDNDEYATATFKTRDWNNDGVLSLEEWRNSL